VTDSDTTLRSVYIWIGEGTWRATVDAALSLAPAGATFTYRGMLGRAGHDPGERLEALASASAADLIEAAARRLGRPCERREIHDQTERAVVAASATADLLIVARDGDRSRLGPKSLGKVTRFVVDHAACPVLLVWPDEAPDVGTIPPPPHHPHHGR